MSVRTAVQSASLAALCLAAATAPSGSVEVVAASQRPALAKSDRLAAPRPAPRVAGQVASMARHSGVAGEVVMRDRDGRIVYHAVPSGSVTRVAANVLLPPLPVPEHAAALAAPPRTAAAQPSSRIPVGCDRLVSLLVRASSASLIGRCLT